MRGLLPVAARAACCGCWLVAALGVLALRDGCWLVAARACCCATFRSLPSVGQRFSRAAARSMSAALSRRSLCLPSAGGASCSFASEAWLEPHETSRRGLRRGSEPCFELLHREARSCVAL